MEPSDSGLSRSVEDYLKAIYALSERGDTASTSAIAEALAVQPASVTGMVKRLAESDLLEHAPYRGVRLTELGVREALKVLRRHRIIEAYLCEHLGYSWEDVHLEAERLEHAASGTLVERMAAALQDPSYDPHGAPIPTRGGQIEETDPSTLAEAAPGSRLRVRAVADEDAGVLRDMEAKGLTPGAHVTVERIQDTEDRMRIRVGEDGGRSHAIREDLARRVFVVPEEV